MLSKEDRINTRADLKDWLSHELKRYDGGFTSLLKITDAGILRKHQILLRKSEYYKNSGRKILSILYRVRLYRYQAKYSIHIPLNTCGRGLFLLHVGPRLINGDATVGRNCSLHINTAIVSGGTREGSPHLGNNIVVGVGAVILGDVTIADGVAIGANAVVNKSVTEENIAVAGVPAKKISNNGRAEWNKKVKIED